MQKNWRLISLLNVETKILSKALLVKLKEVLLTIIASKQTAYVKNRFTGESGRLIFDIIDIYDSKILSGFIVTMDI